MQCSKITYSHVTIWTEFTFTVAAFEETFCTLFAGVVRGLTVVLGGLASRTKCTTGGPLPWCDAVSTHWTVFTIFTIGNGVLSRVTVETLCLVDVAVEFTGLAICTTDAW